MWVEPESSTTRLRHGLSQTCSVRLEKQADETAPRDRTLAKAFMKLKGRQKKAAATR